MFRKVLTGIAITIGVLFIGTMLFLRFNGDPNFLLKKSAVTVKEGKAVQVSERYNSMVPVSGRTNMFVFTPAETAEYQFTLSDINCDEDISLSMIVMDESMSEYAGVSSADAETDTDTSGQDQEAGDGTLSCRVSLQKNSICYIGIDAESSENRSRYSWEYSLTVTKAPEEEAPAEITTDQKVRISLKADEKKCLLFTPAETGYYKFDAEIVAGSKAGYAGIDSVTLDNNAEEAVTDGLCHLEAGQEYYVWVAAYDIRKTAKADVSCRMIGSAAFDGTAEVQIANESVIEFTADEDGLTVIYSVSDGNPDVTVYDADGFPLRNDNDFGAEISENEHDFAVVIDAAAGEVYRIFVSGRFSDCRVIRARYTGDGSTLGPDDIEQIVISSEAAEGDTSHEEEPDGNAAGSEEQQ